ncbi:MAG: hypothetical protein LBL74_05220 [Bacteroidales bacterium]|nr:hypothetical protein [Bacteroidales bacterium]
MKGCLAATKGCFILTKQPSVKLKQPLGFILPHLDMVRAVQRKMMSGRHALNYNYFRFLWTFSQIFLTLQPSKERY